MENITKKKVKIKMKDLKKYFTFFIIRRKTAADNIKTKGEIKKL